MSTFSVGGLMSGIDVETLISQLMSIERLPITQLQTQKTALTDKQTAYEAFSAQLLALKSAAGSLAKQSTYLAMIASTSDTAVARASATSDAAVGSYDLHIDQIATSHKISSRTFASRDQALDLSGEIIINGKTVTVEAGDTLSSLLTKINAAQAGVQATIIQVSSSQYSLSLASTRTGSANTIRLADANDSNILQSMEFLAADTQLRNPISGGAASNGFADVTSSIGALLGLSNAPTGTIQIKGVNVDIDLGTDSLQDIASKINAAGVPGVTAAVQSYEQDGTTSYRLEIAGGGDVSDYTDQNNVLTVLGVIQHGFAHQTTAAQDAQFSIDGVAATRSSNTVGDLVTGVTLYLSKAGDTTITLTRDTASIQQAVQTFVDKYNSVHDYVAQQSSFDSETMVSGTLFGEYPLLSIDQDLANILGSPVYGLWGSVGDRGSVPNTLSAVGITMDTTGKLSLDSARLAAALEQSPDAVSSLFAVRGSTSNSAISFVGSGKYGRASYNTSDARLLSAYGVVITRAAEQARIEGLTQSTQANDSIEKLTFSGGLFPDEVEVHLGAANTIQDTAAQLNRDTRLKGKIVASVEDNQLVIRSLQYGSATSFSVVSDQEAGDSNSGIGTEGLSDAGQDVAGTIGGYGAVGKGQLLTGLAWAQVEASTPQTDALAQDETLTFNGSILGGEPVQVHLTAGMTQEEVVDAINAHSGLTGRVTAQVVDGKLTVRSVRQGSDIRFTVVSDRAAAPDSTGIGTMLIGADTRNSPGDISLLVTATAPGAYGDVTLTMGVGELLDRYLTGVTDSVDGRIATTTKSIQEQMRYMDDEIDSLESRMTVIEERLRKQFDAMETLMGQLSSTSSYLQSQLSSLPGWSTTLGTGLSSLIG
jgi:flagellar hook-associated protein 2